VRERLELALLVGEGERDQEALGKVGRVDRSVQTDARQSRTS
jgi:hypothetical protein